MAEIPTELCARLREIAEDGDISADDSNTICLAVAVIKSLARASFASDCHGALDRVTGHLETWANDHSDERTSEIDAAIYCARQLLRTTPLGSGRSLADATNDPASSDLSSLRKGAEAPCPHAPTYDAGLCCGHPDDCTFVSPSGLSKGASATEDGIRAKLLRLAKALHAKHYAHVPQWEPFEDAYGLIDQIDNMTAALVSGSREEQADEQA